ncbi:MAG: response regulator [Nitrospinota bacterium]
MRVLVVDDDPRIVTVMCALLRAENCDIDTASNGQQALDIAAKRDHELVISDIEMPKMKGLEFFKRLKKAKPDVPVIFITAFQEYEPAVQAMNDGVLAFIRKPFDNDTILKWVEQARSMDMERKGREIALKHMTVHDGEWSFKTAELMDQGIFYPLTCYLVGKMAGCCDTRSKVKRLKLALSIREALRNALEHGNLELSSGMKPEFLLGDSEDEYQRLLKERLADPAFASKKVFIRFTRKDDMLELTIQDEGKGFDHKKYERGSNKQGEIACHGNGLILMRSGVSDVSFNEAGNEVTLICQVD